MIELGPNRYGKSEIRLVKVTRLADRHVLRDLTVSVSLEGDFAAAHTAADNANVIATDTMKNTTYALARDGLAGSIEDFGRLLAGHFLAFPQVARASASIREHGWAPIATAAGPAPDAFLREAGLTRLATVTAAREGLGVEAGIDDLVVMKTTRSAFEGFPRDRFTTLPEASDRLMATKARVTWGYEAAACTAPGFDFDAAFLAVRDRLLEVFASHFSPSVQSSTWQMGQAVLEASPAIEWIRFVLPNLHHWLVDLDRFGMANENEVYVATSEPHGLIEATIRRGPGAPGASG